MQPLRPIKACHLCRRSYTLLQWPVLILDLHETAKLRESENVSPTVEVRHCVCGEPLSLDPIYAATVADAVPADEPEHTASRAEPPDGALEAAPDGSHTEGGWGYHMEEATAIVAYLRVPLVPYPKPVSRCPKRPTDRKAALLGSLLAARMLIDQIIAQATPPPEPAEQPPDEEKPPC